MTITIYMLLLHATPYATKETQLRKLAEKEQCIDGLDTNVGNRSHRGRIGCHFVVVIRS
jgi:hypothetical protein